MNDLLERVEKYLNESKITPIAIEKIASEFFDYISDDEDYNESEAKALKNIKRDLVDLVNTINTNTIFKHNDQMQALISNNLDVIAREILRRYDGRMQG